MKSLVALAVLTVLVSLVSAPALRAQKSFEGTIVWTTMSQQFGDDDKHDLLMNVKGTKFEAEMDLGVNGLIKLYPDFINNKMRIYIVAQKMGFEKSIGAGKSADGDVEFKSLGTKATIAGHPAEAYSLTTSKGEKVAWMTSDFPADVREEFMIGLRGLGKGNKKDRAAMEKLLAKGLVPIKIEEKEAGEVVGSLEFVKLDMHPIDDAVFALPAGVHFQPAPAGMDGE